MAAVMAQTAELEAADVQLEDAKAGSRHLPGRTPGGSRGHVRHGGGVSQLCCSRYLRPLVLVVVVVVVFLNYVA